MSDYKATLNLPQTDFPMKANLTQREPERLKAWADMADDADYIKEPLGASALNALAENLIKRGKADEGIARYEQVAIEFRGANPDAARAAIRRVVPHHVRTKPDAKKLRDFYVAAKTFEHNPQEPGADAASDGLFWGRLREAIKAVTSMIEPLMIVIMGSVVGFIAMAIILPIFKMSSLVTN